MFLFAFQDRLNQRVPCNNAYLKNVRPIDVELLYPDDFVLQ